MQRSRRVCDIEATGCKALAAPANHVYSPMSAAQRQSRPPADPVTRPAPEDARAIALLGAAQALTLAAGFARWKIAALLIGPAGVGIVSVIDQLSQVALQLGSFNLPTVALRFLGAARDRGHAAFGRLQRQLLATTFAACLLVSLGVLAAFRLRPSLIGDDLLPYAAALTFALLTVPVTGVTNLSRSVLASLDRHRAAAVATLVTTVFITGATYAGLRTDGIAGLYGATLIATAMGAVGFRWLSVRGTPREVTASAAPDKQPVWGLLREHPDILRYSLTLYAVGVAVPLTFSVIRALVLKIYGADEAGYLAAVYTVATGARTVFGQTSMQSLTPRASRDAPKALRAAEVASHLRMLAVAMLIVGLPVCLFPLPVLQAVFSPKFAIAAQFLGLILIGELVMAYGSAYRVLLLGFGDLWGYFTTTLAAPATLALGALWAVPKFGIPGAGFVQVGAALLGLMLGIARLRTRHGVAPDTRTLLLCALFLVGLAVATVIGRTPSSGAGPWLVRTGTGVLLALVAVASLPRLERGSLLRLLPGPWRPRRGRA